MLNLVFVKKIDALPLGVERVEIGNWTKTREANEIEGDEKKINSEEFENTKNINLNDDSNSIEIITNLYKNETKSMRTLKAVNDLNSKESTENPVFHKGNKILRTKVRSFEPIYSFSDRNSKTSSYDNLYTWIGSDTSTKWIDGTIGSKIITWPCYVELLEDKSQEETPVEWRMLEGEFQLSDEDINEIKLKKVQPVIGVSTDNGDFQMILPFNDLIHVLINREFTDLNYRSVLDSYKFKIYKDIINYQPINIPENKKYCNKNMHDNLSQHTNGKHIDCSILKPTTADNYFRMIGDISNYISSGVNQYKISLLIGQVARAGEDASSYGGGTSKIDLFLIKNPQFEVMIKPYKIKESEKEYISEDYKFSYNEKILYDLEIINKDENYDFSNLEVDLNIMKELNLSDNIKLDKKVIKLNNKNISDDVSVYLNDDKTPTTIEELSSLKKGDKLIISSDKFNYNITEYDCLREKLEYNYIVGFNYLNDYTYYKYTNTKQLAVKPIGGSLTVTVNSNKEDYFYLKLKGESNFANIKVKNNHTYTICNLDYDKEYKLYLINSSSYKPENSQSFTLQNTSGFKTKNITINANQKTNNYFTQRKIDEIVINR